MDKTTSRLENLVLNEEECYEVGHVWETVQNTPFEYDGEEPLFLYHCLNCEETKVDL